MVVCLYSCQFRCLRHNLAGLFELNSTLSKENRASEFSGEGTTHFFGYTSCPDICPITLTTVKDALENLEPSEVEQVQPLFISVDPEIRWKE